MSADNWTTCPKCTAKREAVFVASKAQLDVAYGKIPADEYLRRIKAYYDERNKTQEQTLREDYEIGIYNGEFSVGYSASCECGYKFRFDHTQKV